MEQIRSAPLGAAFSFLRIFTRRKNAPEGDGQGETPEPSGKKAPARRIVSFETVTLRTSGMRGVSEYEIVGKDGAAEITQYGIRFYECEERRVPKRRAVCSEETALKLLNDSGILSWDGFDGPHPRGVRDGTMFRFTASVNGGQTVSARGSQNFPRHYRDFTDGLYALLENAKEEDSEG
ncbi:MAG: hypothetical protein IJR89_07180 [Clostridia bacterium]|nr:hypothetical protein [Clostridia bacterium]